MTGYLFLPSRSSIVSCCLSQFSRSVVSDSLWHHELQDARPPVHHQLLEFTQTHVHQVGDAIQPSHPLSSFSPPAPNPSPHHSLFQWVNLTHASTGVAALASVLPKNTQDRSPLEWTGWISLQSKGPSRVFFHTTVKQNNLHDTVVRILNLESERFLFPLRPDI